MAFTKEPTRTAVSIADISIQLFDPAPASDATAAASYSVQVKFSDGTLEVRTGDLVPNISAGEITALLNFMASLRVKAVAGFLP